MPLRMTCTAKQSAKQAQASVRLLATSPTASVTSLSVVPAALLVLHVKQCSMLHQR